MLPADMDKDGRHQAPKLAGVVLQVETVHAAKFKDGLTGGRVSKTKNLKDLLEKLNWHKTKQTQK